MDEEIPEELRQHTQEMAEELSGSSVFLVIFNEAMVKEVTPLIQMGLAVYLDKPIYLVMPEERLKAVPENLRRMARGIEVFDDTLHRDLVKTALQAAVSRVLPQSAGDDEQGVTMPTKNEAACDEVRALMDAYISARIAKRGKCEKCRTPTNWAVIVVDRTAYWCGCGDGEEHR